MVYPEERDIVLVGPAEGWALDPRGYFVGAKSGRPMLLLDDLLVALRAAIQSPSVLSCSINPTPEGIRRVNGLSFHITKNLVKDVRLVGHSGRAYGFQGMMYFDPVRKNGIIILMNGGDARRLGTAFGI